MLIPPSAAAPVHKQRRALQPDHLAAILDGVGTLVRLDADDIMIEFAIDRLARQSGATAAVSTSTNPVDILLDLGAGWQRAVQTALEAPGNRAQVVRAVGVVIEQVLAEVRRRVPE